MAEEYTQRPSSRGKSRRERVEHARSRAILDVANELHMELVRSGRDYRWKEHDSMVISPDKNMWNWFSRHQGGDVISLVETMKEVNFNQAIDFLNDGSFKEFTAVERVQDPFSYYLEPYEQPFEAARTYLKDQRGLSNETIDFFLEKGVLAQANAKINGSIEPVVVFKSFDFSGEIVGATLQGIEENREKWPECGYAKNIVRNSDGITGLHVDIGQPNRLIFAESAIDLMSYYELHKDNLQDVRLVSMDGLKEGVIGRHLAQLQSDISGRPLRWSHDQLAEGLQTAIDNKFFAEGKHADWITLAVDNDEAGQNFVSSLRDKGAVVTEALPDLRHGQEKMDWNDALKSSLSDLISKIDQTETVEDHQTIVDEIIADITQDDTAYYLWHDEELHNLGAEDTILEEFHGMLEDRKYPMAGAELYVEDSSNDGATGYLSLDGHVLDRDGILDYLSDQEFSDMEKVEFLTKLQANLPEIWDKVLSHYEDTFKVIVDKYELKSSDSPLIQNQDTESLASEQKTATYDFVKKENEELVKQLEARIKAGEISISFDTDVYFYNVFGNLGNSHPLKYINAKRLEVLAPLQPILASIDDKTVDLYKNKGTEEQDSLYQALKPHQRTLGVDISTRFIGELAIAAYSTNKQLESLSAERFGSYYGTRTFDNLSQSIERMLEYPLNEAGIKDYTYGFVTTPNAFYHYLMEQEGEVVLSRSDVEMLMSRIESQSYQIVEAIQEEVSISEEKEKSLEMNQETNTGGELLNRNSSFLGEDSPGTAPQPVEPEAQPIFPTNVHLHFTTDDGIMSNKAFRKNLRTLNLYANTMRDSAQWYLSEVADTTMRYIYKTSQEDGLQVLSVHFGKKNWMHLTGVTPVYENWVDSLSEQFIDDIANSKGHFKNLKFALGTPDKLKVLNLLPEIIESDTFVFNDLSSVKKLNNLDLSQALNPEDSDLLLLFRDEGIHQVPASLMKIKGELKEKMSDIDSGTVLGVYRERDGQLEQISINEEYVKDGGQEMLSILENKQYEEAIDVSQEIVPTDVFSAELFTQVLDAAYNVGDPRKLGTQVPEESKVAWERYYELSDNHEGNFSAVVDAVDQLGLVDKNSNFYQEWNQDRIFSETYHVRLQWAETWPDGFQIPFKETELVDYQTFAEELYKQNRAFYEHHQESVATVDATGNQDAYIPYTKVKFDVYAPGGTLIKDNVRYDIGDETEPISRLLGLGYRRLEGQPELAAIDEKILSKLENQEVNQEIATEANEQSLNSNELLPEEDYSRGSFYSPNQKIKTNLAQRVEEIMAEDKTKILVASVPQIQENLSVEGNLVGTPQSNDQMLYTNREEFGQDYQLELAVHSPKAIDFLEDVQAPWTLALMRGEEKLGYLAYGSDWGNDFQIHEELERVAEQIGVGKAPEGLYQQEEVGTFLASNQGKERSKGQQTPTISAEPFDYTSASAYDISEHAFQKIREYTQSPKDLLEYMDFMSKFPKLSPRNVALIHEQWRGANAVATYDQWKSMGEALGIKPEDVIQTKATYTNKRTGETKEVIHQGLSVKTGEKAKITLFRPLMVRMIPVLDENGHQVKNDKGNPKYKKLSEATSQEKALVKDGKLPVRQFQERDSKTGYPRFTTYKVFELSQTTLKPESYPKAMPNRHYNFNVDKVKTKEVLEGLCDYAEGIGITMMKDEAHVLGNAKGAFYPGEQLILINPDNTPGEKIATTIHELAHATLHNPKLANQYQELPKGQKEFEAEMTSHLLSKYFGLDTSEKAIDYMASWTDNLKALDDKQLTDSLKRVHKTVSNMMKHIENHTKPYSLGKNREQAPNFPKPPTKGPSR
ncbi:MULTISPECIES: PBECR4 domain-containing protein [unclassified Streptococcus]|uniref:PBECR4 domain-containing protein n=1 Tax=unclassified Streptococcus TaxID=2608887 RepID=UPI0010728B20|nr:MULTISPECIES: PBECR4 domain-containing protein [unclassified Streptococcus]MBF0786952.1 toprim domain-containing protein [Streptococcus sp. 19428wC2_LYSM12]MCQ9211496.1 PBECR4 domain-containing protein [Streptococcus sp. B01]MCQ9214812.1 PBECR4 domain-containing protein [Streptococcus sp. O1]TFV06151.1 toprim [Streptococcus sp. LYSM12]